MQFHIKLAGQVTHTTQANKKVSKQKQKNLVNSTSLLFNRSDWWRQIVNSDFIFFFKYDCHIREMKTQQNKLYKGKVE